MKSVKIKTKNGEKDYITVNERVKEFRRLYQTDMSLMTELVSDVNGECVFRAIVSDSNGRIISTGYAKEKESASFLNKTSYIENAETSAVGRALGFLGIGIDTSIASADEVKNAIEQQGATNKQRLWSTCHKLGIDTAQVIERFGLTPATPDKDFIHVINTIMDESEKEVKEHDR